MGISPEVVAKFAKALAAKQERKNEEQTAYGTVVIGENGDVGVRLDGSEQITPVATVLETDEAGEVTNWKYGSAAVDSGDRVSVTIKNRQAVITGNLSDAALGGKKVKAEIKALDEHIEIIINEKVTVEFEEMKTTINTLTEFNDGLANGTTIIDGACIKTGTIHASQIIMDSLVLVRYSSDSSAVGTTPLTDPSKWHEGMISEDKYRSDSCDGGATWTGGYQFVGKDGVDGSDGKNGSYYAPDYLELQGLDFTSMTDSYIKSPTIYAGKFVGDMMKLYPDSGEVVWGFWSEDDELYCGIKLFDQSSPPFPEYNSYTKTVGLYPMNASNLFIGRSDQKSLVNFYGNVDFSDAFVTGITAVWG